MVDRYKVVVGNVTATAHAASHPDGQYMSWHDYDALRAEVERLHDMISSDWFQRVTYKQQTRAAEARVAELEERLDAMMPLFEEARDALPAITLGSAKLRGIRLDLADRMDDVGDPERWAARAALRLAVGRPDRSTRG